jgi:predicted transposase YdaD
MRPNFITWEQAVAEEAENRVISMIKQTKLDTARKLLALNLLSVEQIAQALGLSVQEVKELVGQDPSA